MFGVAWNAKQLHILSYNLEALVNTSAAGLQALQTEVDSVASMLIQHKIALNYLLSSE
ncbi:hypothetical protein JRQ81_012397, partial [Phrynocephalus forsythii]